MATTAQIEATVALRETELARAREDLARRAPLAAGGALPAEELQHARDAVASSRAALDVAKQQLAAQKTLTDHTTVETHPEVQSAAARVREAYLAYARTAIPAPVSGIVDKRSVQVGQRVGPGAPLMAVIPLDQVWVDANFKERQLLDLRVGQPAKLTADIYGSAVEFHGRVAGFGAGTGSAFALLPPQNATGNWIKVVQRVPVRITLDPAEIAKHPLRLGLSMLVDVDTHQRGGEPQSKSARTAPAYQAKAFTLPHRSRGPAHRRHHRGQRRQRDRRAPGGKGCSRSPPARIRRALNPVATAALPSTAPAAAHRAPLLLTMLLAAANFMQVLDLTIANVSLPAITGDLGAATDQGAWVITSYAVANAITVPLTGWLSDRYGQARLFAIATALFTLASFLCGMSWTLPMLITARVLQGAMAGFMVPLSQALLLGNYPPEKRGMALAIWSATTTVAPIVGPLLGGWITDNAHWSWIFFINIPIGTIAALGVWQLLKDRETPLRRRPLDRVGLALIVIWVGCLQVLLDKGNELDWFNSEFIVILAVIVVVSFSLFLVWELTDAHPIVDLELFRHRNFGMSALALSLSYGLFLGSMVDHVAVDADADGLHRAVGRLCHGAGRHFRHIAGAGGRPQSAAHRPAPVRHRRLHRVRGVLLLALAVHHRLGLLHHRGAAAAAGRGRGHVFRAAGQHQHGRHRPRSHGLGDRHAEFPAHHVRQLRHFARDRAVEPARIAAPRAACRAHQRLFAPDHGVQRAPGRGRHAAGSGARGARPDALGTGQYARHQRRVLAVRLPDDHTDSGDLAGAAAIRPAEPGRGGLARHGGCSLPARAHVAGGRIRAGAWRAPNAA